MNRIIRTTLVSGGCAAALTFASVVPAFAATSTPAPHASHAPETLAQVQAKGAADITKRLDSLSKATARVNAAKGVTDGDRAIVLKTFASDTSGLTALKAKIAADTSLETAKADVKSIYTTYRIYAVALPQARIALGSDRIGSVTVERMQKAHDRLADKPGADTAKLAQMQQDITTAEHDVSGLSAKALAVTPAQFDANHSVLTPLKSSFKSAVSAVKDAESIAKSLHGSAKSGK